MPEGAVRVVAAPEGRVRTNPPTSTDAHISGRVNVTDRIDLTGRFIDADDLGDDVPVGLVRMPRHRRRRCPQVYQLSR